MHTLNTDWLPEGFVGYRLGAGVGGWCERGETPWQTAVREAQEETETSVTLVHTPRTLLVEPGATPSTLSLDDRPAPLVVSRFARANAYGVLFVGEHEGELAPGDDVAALLLLPLHVWPQSQTTLGTLIAAGGAVIGDVADDAAVWPHPDDSWPVVRALVANA